MERTLTQEELIEAIHNERMNAFKVLDDVANAMTKRGLSMADMQPLIVLMAFYWGTLNLKRDLFAKYKDQPDAVYMFKVLEIVFQTIESGLSVDMDKVMELAEEFSDKNFEELQN